MGVDSNFQECKPTKYLVRLNAVQLPYFFYNFTSLYVRPSETMESNDLSYWSTYERLSFQIDLDRCETNNIL